MCLLLGYKNILFQTVKFRYFSFSSSFWHLCIFLLYQDLFILLSVRSSVCSSDQHYRRHTHVCNRISREITNLWKIPPSQEPVEEQKARTQGSADSHLVFEKVLFLYSNFQTPVNPQVRYPLQGFISFQKNNEDCTGDDLRLCFLHISDDVVLITRAPLLTDSSVAQRAHMTLNIIQICYHMFSSLWTFSSVLCAHFPRKTERRFVYCVEWNKAVLALCKIQSHRVVLSSKICVVFFIYINIVQGILLMKWMWGHQATSGKGHDCN